MECAEVGLALARRPGDVVGGRGIRTEREQNSVRERVRITLKSELAGPRERQAQRVESRDERWMFCEPRVDQRVVGRRRLISPASAEGNGHFVRDV